MKIIIQNRKTNTFFKGPGEWTRDVEKAQSFGGALIAFQFAQQEALGDTEVVFVNVEQRGANAIGQQEYLSGAS